MARIAATRSTTLVSRRTPGRGRAVVDELVDGAQVPVGRDVAQPATEPGGQLDVGQRVAAEPGEAVAGRGVGPAQDQGVVAADRLGGDLVVGGLGGRVDQPGVLGQGGQVRLAAGGAGEGVEGGDPDRAGRQPAGLRQRGAHPVGAAAAGVEGVERLVDDHAPHLEVVADEPLEVVEVQPQPEELGVPPAAPDQLHEAVDLAGEVAGAELGQLRAAGQVGRRDGVPHHHVGAGVDELADPRAGHLRHRVDPERPARDRPADALRTLGGQLRWQPRHPGGRLGLPVHHDQLPAGPPAALGPGTDPVGREPAAGLCDVAQGRQPLLVEAGVLELLEGVGDTREGRRAGLAREPPEALVDDREVGQHQPGAGQQVAVHDREAVAVVHRQRGDRAVLRGEPEVRRDAGRVAAEVVVGEPHQLG